MKSYGLFCCIMLIACITSAQTLTCQAPSSASIGESFRLSYTIDHQDATDLVLGQMPDALEILYGPARSSGSTISIVNGKTTQSYHTTFTYTVKADRSGTFVIPTARITANGHEVASQPVTITINENESESAPGSASESTSSITDEDLFIIASTDKDKLNIGDSLTLKFKLYTTVSLSLINNKSGLQIDGCYYKEQNATATHELKKERYNGKTYNTCEWQTYTLVPLRTGTITIPAREFEAVVVTKNNNTDPFDAFFNGGNTITEVKRNISSAELTIKVNE